VHAKLCGLEHRAPPIFGRATITLGTGPHSSLLVYEISLERLNAFVLNSWQRRVWSLAQTSLNVKVKGQGNHGHVQLMLGKTSLALVLSSLWHC